MIVQRASLTGENVKAFGRILVGYLTALILVQWEFFLPQTQSKYNPLIFDKDEGLFKA